MKARHEFETDESYKSYLRIYYAGQAMKGLLSGPVSLPKGATTQTVAQISINQADALIKALNETP